MKRIAAVLMLAALSLAAQDNKKDQPKPPGVYVEKLFVLKYADPGPVMTLVRALGGSGNENTPMRAIAVTAEKGAMAVIEDAVKQLDVPSAAPKDVQLTAYLIVGTDSESAAGSSVPKELESVVTQLKGALPFKNYGVMDVIEGRTYTGRRMETESAGGTVMVNGQATAVTTSLRVDVSGMAQDGSTMRLDNVQASVNWPGHNLRLAASVDAKEGQKVVVGRVSVAHDQALFLVLTAHVVQ